MKKRMTRMDQMTLLLFNVFAVFMTIVCLYPMYNILVLSILSPAEAYKGGLRLFPNSVSFAAYRQILDSKEILNASVNSVLRVVIGTTITVVLTTLVSYPLSKREEFPGYHFWMTFILIPTYFSGGLIPTYLAYQRLGMINNLAVLVLPMAISSYNIMMTRNFLRSVPVSLEESARIDGATEFQIWLKIILPLSLPIMATVALWSAVGHWNAFFDVLIYIQDRSKYTLQIILRRMLMDNEVNIFLPTTTEVLQNTSDVPPPGEQLKAAFIVACTVPILVVYPFAQKYFMKGIMVGAVKG